MYFASFVKKILLEDVSIDITGCQQVHSTQKVKNPSSKGKLDNTDEFHLIRRLVGRVKM